MIRRGVICLSMPFPEQPSDLGGLQFELEELLSIPVDWLTLILLSVSIALILLEYFLK